jgi:hypothetical protein
MSATIKAVRDCLKSFGSRNPDHRFDANDTAWTERQATQVRSKLFEVKYTDLKAMELIPLATDIAAEPGPYVYNVLDMVGEAKVIAAGSDDLPRVDVSATERSGKVMAIGASYGWDVFELRKAARLNIPLTEQKARSARNAIARQVDKMLASGTTDSQTGLGLEGFINNTDVTALGIGVMDHWVLGTTAATVMIAEVNAIVNTIVSATSEAWIPDTIVLPTSRFTIFASAPYGTDADTTALTWFTKNNPYIKNVTSWHRLTGAGASSKDRMIVYKRSPDVLEGVVPLVFDQEAPQARNLEMVTPCYAFCGGVKIYHPEAMRYADFDAS